MWRLPLRNLRSTITNRFITILSLNIFSSRSNIDYQLTTIWAHQEQVLGHHWGVAELTSNYGPHSTYMVGRHLWVSGSKLSKIIVSGLIRPWRVVRLLTWCIFGARHSFRTQGRPRWCATQYALLIRQAVTTLDATLLGLPHVFLTAVVGVHVPRFTYSGSHHPTGWCNKLRHDPGINTVCFWSHVYLKIVI